MVSEAELPIGVFDSGVGGLTVVRSIEELLPQEHIVYFGDTARAPYGPRPVEEVREFAFEIMDMLSEEGVKMMVIACNAMTAAAFREAVERYDVPVIGVIEPAVRSAVTATRNGKIGVIGTKATISTGEYDRALKEMASDLEIFSQICPMFVERVEAGDTFSQELIEGAQEYLAPLMEASVDTLVLGCTHYPLLRGVLHWVTRGEVVMISSADEVAKDMYSRLVSKGLLRTAFETGRRRFLVSGDPDHFRRVASRFLPSVQDVENRLPGGRERGGSDF